MVVMKWKTDDTIDVHGLTVTLVTLRTRALSAVDCGNSVSSTNQITETNHRRVFARVSRKYRDRQYCHHQSVIALEV